jgi:predicted RNA polymerase sigma factor
LGALGSEEGPADARAALTLRVIGGLTRDEIARAFLSSEVTIAQRIVRAKKTIGKAGLSCEVPRGAALLGAGGHLPHLQ